MFEDSLCGMGEVGHEAYLRRTGSFALVLRRTCELKGTMTECRNRVKTS